MLIARVLLFIIMKLRIEKSLKLSSQKNFEDDTIDRQMRCDTVRVFKLQVLPALVIQISAQVRLWWDLIFAF